jgi:tetratricopeptide (TPR) repeat protein
MQMALASTALFTGGGSDRVFAATALDLAIDLNDIRGEVSAYLALWGYALRASHYLEALDFAGKCFDTAGKIDDPGLKAMAEWMLGATKHRLGRHPEARLHLQRSLYTDTETSRNAQLRQVGYDRRTDTLAVMSNLLWLQGLPRQAERMDARAIEMATVLGFPLPISVARTWTCLNKYLSGIDIDAIEDDALELAEHGRAHSAGGYQGTGSYQGIGICILGLCQARRGQYDDARMLVDEGLKLLADGQYGIFNSTFRTELILAAIDAERYDDAASWMAALDAEDVAEDLGSEHWWTPEILRARGALALRVDKDAAKAENLFRQSIALAQKQGALAWELRATLALSELRASQGRGKDALAPLSAICDRFTEGVETVDLSRAREVLGGLGSLA